MDATVQPQEQSQSQPPQDPRPWPRYFARVIDVVLLGLVSMFVLGIVLEIFAEGGAQLLVKMSEGIGGMVLSSMLLFVLALPLVAGLLAFAQTPGKWLFGIRVRNADGSRMGLWKALKREAWVLVRGVGFGFPVVTLFTHIMSYSDLKDDGATVWDRRLRCDVRHAPATPLWWVRAALGGTAVIAFSVWGYIDSLLSIVRS